MSNLERVHALIDEGVEEIRSLQHQRDQGRQEIHQLKQRLTREQARNVRLEDQVAELELRIAEAEQRAENARAATLAHTSRTT